MNQSRRITVIFELCEGLFLGLCKDLKIHFLVALALPKIQDNSLHTSVTTDQAFVKSSAVGQKL